MFPIDPAVAAHLDAQKDTWPVRLFQLGGVPDQHFCDMDRPVMWNGIIWRPRGISYSKIQIKRDFELDTYKITVDNIEEDLIAWALANDPRGYVTKVYKAFLDGTTNEVDDLLPIGDQAYLLFQGRNTRVRADAEMEFEVTSGLDLARQRGPRVMQHRLCRFQGIDGFKGRNCGYTGNETECNYTFERCRELGNEARFGGFPDISTRDDE